MRPTITLLAGALAGCSTSVWASPAPIPQDATTSSANATSTDTSSVDASSTDASSADASSSSSSTIDSSSSVSASLSCTAKTFKSALPAGAKIVSAVKVPAGSSYGEGAADIAYPTNPTNLPELCAVIVNVTSSPTSFFRVGMFLPTKWNSKFLAVGNGAFAGGINWLDMGNGVRYGHAVVSTDTGHNSTGLDLSWALNAPEKRKDFGYRAIHGSVTVGKALTEAYYSKDITYSYYAGASTGGRQGLKEIQLYADSFDGALIGAPAWWTSHLQPWTTKAAVYNLPVGAPNNIPVPLFATLGNEVIRQCDPLDGVKDGIVSYPEQCPFNINTIQCGSATADPNNCLTAAQVQTAKNEYADYIANGKFAFPGLEYGSESMWPILLGLPFPLPLGDGYMQYFLFNNPNWNWTQYNDSIVWIADAQDPGDCTADNYNMAAFKNAGGKILMNHGYADGLIPTRSSTIFYNNVASAMGGVPALQSWFRYFLVPGMQHVGGTAVDAPWYFAGGNQAGILGTDVYSVPGFADAQHDAFLALMAWVEKGTAPDQIIATTWKNSTDPSSGVLRQRPLCPYPKKQVYVSGNEKLPSSWKCAP